MKELQEAAQVCKDEVWGNRAFFSSQSYRQGIDQGKFLSVTRDKLGRWLRGECKAYNRWNRGSTAIQRSESEQLLINRNRGGHRRLEGGGDMHAARTSPNNPKAPTPLVATRVTRNGSIDTDGGEPVTLDFGSSHEAARKLGVDPSNISKCLNGSRKTVQDKNGLRWSFSRTGPK